LTVTGDTLVNNLGITGSINSGLLVINGLNMEGDSSASIYTLSGDLKLQELGLGNLDIFDGSIVMTPEGDIATVGTIRAGKYAVDTSDPASASVGQVVIPAGQSSLEIASTALTDDSLIFVTPDQPLTIVAGHKLDQNHFIITLHQAQVEDLKINWWVIN